MIAGTSSGRSRCRVLVLGAYGLIGSGISRRLATDGFTVCGLGRNASTAHKILPAMRWIIRDLRQLSEAESWKLLLEEFDMVVNCAGALQDGADDNLDLVHVKAISALAKACREADIGLVQISAIGVDDNASTRFMRSKSAGDLAVKNTGIRHWILRPGLVIAPSSYGGSQLLRMLAAFPLLQPLAYPDSRIQTVALADVESAVSMALQGQLPAGTECDLVADDPLTLREIVKAHRTWLGIRPALVEFIAPGWMRWLTRKSADCLGLLGWRSPARSAAMRVLSEGLIGNPDTWHKLTKQPLLDLGATLTQMPATGEDRQFARMALLMPVMVAALFVFWLASGIIGLWKTNEASQVLINAGWPSGLAMTAVIFWAVVDIAIALMLVVRKYARMACLAMIVVSAIYLIFATFAVPELWGDPLGPLVKVIPGMMLALVTRVALEAR